MSFSHLNASLSDLRDALRTLVDPAAIADVNVRPPAGEADESSFVRLVTWCYAALFECSRVSVPFLLKLQVDPISKSDAVQLEVRESVRVLRTWLSHNLGFEVGHDLDVRKAASNWFVRYGGAIAPSSEAQWRGCFARLAADVSQLLQHVSAKASAIAAMEIEDREIILADWRIRLKRDWTPHEFEKYVSDAAVRLGGEVNARALCETRITVWRQFLLALPPGAKIELEIERLIDGEVAQHLRSRPPVSAGELMRALQLEAGPVVRRALDLAQEQVEKGIRDPLEIIAAVRKALT